MPKSKNTEFDKPEWREKNVAFLLWAFRSFPLAHGYMEMFGDSGMASYKLMHERGVVSAQAPFFAVDNDLGLLFRLRLKACKDGRPVDLMLLRGDAYAIAKDLSRAAREGKAADAYNFDTMNLAGSGWWDENGQLLREVTADTNKRSGACALIFNHVIDDLGGRKSSELLVEHVGALCQTFKPWGMAPSQILATGSRQAEKVDDRSFGAKRGEYVGKCYVYQSKTLRMVTIRVLIRGGTASIYKEIQ